MASKKENVVEIQPVVLDRAELTIVGDTPLIMHAWSSKAKKMMLDAQTGKAKGKKKEFKSPMLDFVESMYWLTEKPVFSESDSEEDRQKIYIQAVQNGAKFGFPVTGLKQAAISAAYRKGWTKDKMSLRGVFFIEGGFGELMEIQSDPPVMREDMVKIGLGTADIRYRGEFRNWSAKFIIKYDKNGQYDIGTIINIINAGGVACGLGEWRPERDGQFGMFHVAAN